MSNPYQNQRLKRPGRQRKQQHLLEVSIRRDRERALRIRAVSWFIFKLVVYVAVIVGLVVGGRESFRRYVWQNPYFFLDDTHVHTDGTLTREQILTAAGVSETMNFFQLNLGKVREGIQKLPQVEHVEIARSLPNKLNIDISERQPIAWLTDKSDFDPTATDGSFLIDGRGYVMTSKKRRQDFIHLPVISGVVLEDFAAGQKATALEIQAALELIRLNADSTRWQVRNVDIARGFCLVVTDRSRARITFGLDNIDRQLTRLYRILDYLEPEKREIQTVNLLVERNTPVTFVDELPPVLEAALAPPPTDIAPVRMSLEKPVIEKLSRPKVPEAVLTRSNGGFTGGSTSKSKPTPTPSRRSTPSSSSKSKRGSSESVKKPFRNG
jgi:cell division septal protein FtsQ